jgi:hypothetical protein
VASTKCQAPLPHSAIKAPLPPNRGYNEGQPSIMHQWWTVHARGFGADSTPQEALVRLRNQRQLLLQEQDGRCKRLPLVWNQRFDNDENKTGGQKKPATANQIG